MTAPMLNVGASVESIQAARDAVLDILRQTPDNKTARMALRVFAHVCAVNNVSISGCTFTGSADPAVQLNETAS